MHHIRWLARVTYRTEMGPIGVEHDLEEIADLHSLVEAGPHWDTIISIEITRENHCESQTLTVEEADQL